MQTTRTMRNARTSMGIAKSKIATIPHALTDAEKPDLLPVPVGKANAHRLWKTVWWFYKNRILVDDPVVTFLTIYPREVRILSTHNSGRECPQAAWFTTARCQKQP